LSRIIFETHEEFKARLVEVVEDFWSHLENNTNIVFCQEETDSNIEQMYHKAWLSEKDKQEIIADFFNPKC